VEDDTVPGQPAFAGVANLIDFVVEQRIRPVAQKALRTDLYKLGIQRFFASGQDAQDAEALAGGSAPSLR